MSKEIKPSRIEVEHELRELLSGGTSLRASQKAPGFYLPVAKETLEVVSYQCQHRKFLSHQFWYRVSVVIEYGNFEIRPTDRDEDLEVVEVNPEVHEMLNSKAKEMQLPIEDLVHSAVFQLANLLEHFDDEEYESFDHILPVIRQSNHLVRHIANFLVPNWSNKSMDHHHKLHAAADAIEEVLESIESYLVDHAVLQIELDSIAFEYYNKPKLISTEERHKREALQ